MEDTRIPASGPHRQDHTKEHTKDHTQEHDQDHHQDQSQDDSRDRRQEHRSERSSERSSEHRDHRRPTRRWLLAGGSLALAGAAAWSGHLLATAASASPAGDGPAGGAGDDAGAGGARLTLPAPTGPHPVGTVSVHLVDHARPDPWVPSVPYRELMVTVRYPAGDVARHPRAPQLARGAAAGFDRVNNLGGVVPAGRVDWAATRTFAHQGARLDRRGGPRPVVLYSPGVVDPAALGTTLTDELASRGYVVVAFDHTYETSAVEFPGGRVVATRMPQEFAAAQRHGTVEELLRKTTAVRVADTRFVLGQLAAGAAGHGPFGRLLGGAVDAAAVGMFGQSAGGFTALQTMHDDPRLRAGANLDGVLSYVQEDSQSGHLSTVAAEGLDRPVLLMGMAGDDRHTVPSWEALWRHSTGWRRDLTLRHSRHASYTDVESMLPQIADQLGLADAKVTETIGTVQPRRAVAAQRAYLAAFFDRWLRGRDDGGLLDRPSRRYPDVEFVR